MISSLADAPPSMRAWAAMRRTCSGIANTFSARGWAGLAARFADVATAYGVAEFVVARCAVALLLVAVTGRSKVVTGTYTQGRAPPGWPTRSGSTSTPSRCGSGCCPATTCRPC
jgi:hypothetical protein